MNAGLRTDLSKFQQWFAVAYGAIGYKPLDYSGAIGRYFRVGVKHPF
jgi:hypothetical protein